MNNSSPLLPKNRPVDDILRPIHSFMRLEAASGSLLLFMAMAALIIANSSLASTYFGLLNTPLGMGLGAFSIEKPLLLWIDDGLMAVFFLVISLEIKREILSGELSSPREAILPIVAAFGGMIVPAEIYLAITGGSVFSSGWGIPMATDIAFALAILTLLGSRAPLSLKIFLTAVALIDNLAAFLFVAITSSGQLNFWALASGAGIWVVLLTGNRLGIQRTTFYTFLGVALWLAFLESGIDATITGVLLAVTIPSRSRIETKHFMEKANLLVQQMRDTETDNQQDNPRNVSRRDLVHSLEVLAKGAESPLSRMRYALHGWVALFVMPAFVFANAGIDFRNVSLTESLLHPLSLGIICGLFIGKQLGVFLFSWLAVRMKLTSLPEGVTWRQLYGVALLSGIGFTMSIFIGGLSIGDPETLSQAKMGILVASILSGVLGYAVLRSAGVKDSADSDSAA